MNAKVTDTLLKQVNAGRATPVSQRQLQNKVDTLKVAYRDNSGVFSPTHSDPTIYKMKIEYMKEQMLAASQGQGAQWNRT